MGQQISDSAEQVVLAPKIRPIGDVYFLHFDVVFSFDVWVTGPSHYAYSPWLFHHFLLRR